MGILRGRCCNWSTSICPCAVCSNLLIRLTTTTRQYISKTQINHYKRQMRNIDVLFYQKHICWESFTLVNIGIILTGLTDIREFCIAVVVVQLWISQNRLKNCYVPAQQHGQHCSSAPPYLMTQPFTHLTCCLTPHPPQASRYKALLLLSSTTEEATPWLP